MGIGQPHPLGDARHFLFVLVFVLVLAMKRCEDLPEAVVTCSQPPVLLNMTAPLSIDTAVNSTAVYSCLEGHVTDSAEFDDVTFTCNETGHWEGPDVTCHYVDCGQPEAPDNKEVSSSMTSYLAEAVVTCRDGFLADQHNVTSVCQRDGNWSTENLLCQAVDCGPAPDVDLSFRNWTGSSGHLARADYQCYSGHVYRLGTFGGQSTAFTLICSAQYGVALWDGADSGNTSCQLTDSFEGCFQDNSTVAMGDGYGWNGCTTSCLAENSPYAKIRGAQCACTAAVPPSEALANPEECNRTCDQSEGKLCGGEPDLWSVYSTFQGCFSGLTKDGGFESLTEVTCTEHCRGLGSPYAAHFDAADLCVCYNATQTGVVSETYTTCEADDDVHVGKVFLLEKETPPNAATCMALFSKGVHRHGNYYLKGDNLTTHCNFYDGSATCEQGWLSYDGHCYLFGLLFGNFTYEEAWAECRSQDAHLITVNTLAEETFIRTVLAAIPPYGQGKSWHLGLFDHHKVFAHQWQDGALVTDTLFAAGQPNNADHNCVQFSRVQGGVEWFGSDCLGRQGYICERSTGVYGCIRVDDAFPAAPSYTFQDDTYMALTFCFETCRGRDALFAALSGTSCHCYSASLPAHTLVPWSQCNSTCVGNRYQLCGDTSPGAQRLFVVQDVGQANADSCAGLELQGLTGSQLKVKVNGTAITTDCSNSSEVVCPYSFATLDGRCYKYFPRTDPAPYVVCNAFDAYLGVLDNQREIDTVFNDTSVLSGMTEWLVGLFTAGTKSKRYRASSGRSVTGLAVPDGFTLAGPCVRWNTNSSQLAQVACDTLPFVCEKGIEFAGCGYMSVSDHLAAEDYPEMSVPQCVELCRGRREPFALLGNTPFRCYCSQQKPERVTPETKCSEFCFPDNGQVCGGAGFNVTSVYRVDHFPAFANSCADLFEADVQLPGTYLVNDTPAFCYMQDNSSCTAPDHRLWEGLGLNGSCLAWSLALYQGQDALSTCLSVPGSGGKLYLPASVHSETERGFMGTVYYTLKDAYDLHNIHIGGADDLKMGAFTWADGWLMTSPEWAWHVTCPLMNHGQEAGPGVSTAGTRLMLNQEALLVNTEVSTMYRGLVCRELADDLGCYVNPGTLTPVLSNYSSMSIALCKQTCAGQRAELLSLLDTGACYCVSGSEVATLTPAADQSEAGCSTACPLNGLQVCASPGLLRAYRIDPDDVADTCDTLHANFIVINNTYVMRDNVTARCGFADTTICPVGYAGYEGHCFRFFPWSYHNAQRAADTCFLYGGYLATPRDLNQMTFLRTAITSIQSLSAFSEWRLGAMSTVQGPLAAAADGWLLWNETWAEGDDRRCTSANVSALTVNMTSCETTLPFVCQIAPAFRGCISLPAGLGEAIAFNVTSSSVTVQQCLTLCYGQGRRYALVTNTSCSCVTSDVIAGGTQDACPGGCADYTTQPCGSADLNIYAAFDVDAYTVPEKTAASCDQYRQLQVTARGRYYLRLPDDITLLPVTCGTYGQGHDDIMQEDSSVDYASSSNNVSVGEQAVRLHMEAAVWTSWQPRSDDASPWVQVTLSDYYIIKAVVITGDASWDGGHVSEVSLHYGWSANDLTAYNTTLTGQGTSLSVHYLPRPLVTRVVRLYPLSWDIAPALSTALLGEPYANFNHSDLFVGCFADPLKGEGLVSPLSPLSLTQCVDHCRLLGYPLLGLLRVAGSDTCGCSSGVSRYGEADVTSCNVTCVNASCGSDVDLSVAFYRAYEKKCDAPPDVTNATRTVTSLVVSPDDVYGTGAQVTYTCVTGHEMAGVGKTMTMTCQQNNTWSALPSTPCLPVPCGTPVTITHGDVTYDGVTYGATATYRCHEFFATAEGYESADISCSETGAWSPSTPVCSSPLPVRQKTVCLQTPGRQISGGSVTSVRARSVMDCATRCLLHHLCFQYSAPAPDRWGALPPGADNCRLNLGALSDPTYHEDAAWQVYSLAGGC